MYYSTAGTYYDSLQTIAGCDSVLVHELIVNTLPIPLITQNGSILTSSPAVSYQWYQSNTLLIIENDQSFTATVSGSYSVVVTDSNGCSGSSDTLVVTVVGIDEIKAKPRISVFPNPFKGQANVHFYNLENHVPITIEVHNLIGKRMLKKTIMDNHMIIHCNDFPPGIYFIEIKGKSIRLAEKLIIK